MASRRPPLFELLQDTPERSRGGNGVGGSGRQPRPPSAVETKPETKPASKQPAAPAPAASQPATAPAPARSTAPHRANGSNGANGSSSGRVRPEARPSTAQASSASDWSGLHPRRRVSLPLVWVYFGLPLVTILIVATWWAGYSVGGQQERRRLEPWLADGGVRPPQDPMLVDAAGRDGSGKAAPPAEPVERRGPVRSPLADPARSQPAPQATPTPTPTPAAGSVDVTEDVREGGNNYLKLASGMSRERAVGLAEHLTAGGIRAMALDEGRGLFGLYTAMPIPSERFSELEAERRRHEARVRELLRTAPTDAGGSFEPRGEYWARFRG